MQGAAFTKFQRMLQLDRPEGSQKDPQREKTAEQPSEPRGGQARKLVAALAVSAGTLMLVGQKRVASLVALCALAMCGGKKNEKEVKQEKQEELKRSGGRANKLSARQDGKPLEEGRATEIGAQDGKPPVAGRATVGDGEKDEALASGTAIGDLGVGVGDLPGIRAFRGPSRMSSHGTEQRPLAPGGDQGEVRVQTTTMISGPWRITAGHVVDRVVTQSGYGAPSEAAGGNEPRPRGPRSRAREIMTEIGGNYDEELRSHPQDAGRFPWEQPEFQSPPLGPDKWLLTLWDQGWIVRSHGQWRKQPFMPVWSTTPCPANRLDEKRVTILFHASTDQQQIREDSWMDTRWKATPTQWRGYTFFKRRMIEDSAPSQRGHQDTQDSEFELVEGP